MKLAGNIGNMAGNFVMYYSRPTAAMLADGYYILAMMFISTYNYRFAGANVRIEMP